LFTCQRERERASAQARGGAEGEGEADSPAEQEAQLWAQFQDPGIMTWAEGRSLTD